MDNITRPAHYTQHPSGLECIEITRYLPFSLGNAVKYLWRTDLKNGREDLQKAAWYLDDITCWHWYLVALTPKKLIPREKLRKITLIEEHDSPLNNLCVAIFLAQNRKVKGARRYAAYARREIESILKGEK